MKKTVILSFLTCAFTLTGIAQNRFQRMLPGAGFVTQYAGSTGFISAGYFRHTGNKRSEIGAMYGYTPQSLGGPLSALTLKYTYNPFRLKIGQRILWEPVQAGAYITAWFGENLDVAWSARYPRGYYWWQSSMRKHAFASTQLSLTKKSVEKMSFYFEVNTNDLYLVGYYPNRETQAFSDILFFGIGCKIYLNQRVYNHSPANQPHDADHSNNK